MPAVSRRQLLKLGVAGFGSLYVTHVLSGCSDSKSKTKLGEGRFEHGVASGDPLPTSVILWTRVSPQTESKTTPAEIRVAWDVATDEAFTNIIATDKGMAKQAQDYTVKVDLRDLTPNSRYYYRFRTADNTSATGKTRTLPEGTAESLTMAVLSCSNYPAGYFHVYAEVAKLQDLDLVLHLGDYIYEYGASGYATENAVTMGRVPSPAADTVSLSDYRTRYAQYRSDPDLQAAHAAVPFLLVWDDHEVANDSWRDGAENHDETQGDYSARREAAMRAYFEWLPIRPSEAMSDADLAEPSSIYRQFEWGDLVNILMLDTRHESRDQSIDIAVYFDSTTGAFDFTGFFAAVNAEEREMLGAEQREWLNSALASSAATWQLLGQQVLMGKMYLPFAIASQALSVSEYAELGQLAVLANRAQAQDPSLTEAELAYLAANQARLTPEVIALLSAPAIPYNLDAWDGFGAERERVYTMAREANANLVVLAGDTHNAWANQLSDASGNAVGVELATSSVSSPGLEVYLGLSEADYAGMEAGLVSLVEGLKYLNCGDRGWLQVNFTHTQLTAQWQFVSAVNQASYTLLSGRSKTLVLAADGEHQLQEV